MFDELVSVWIDILQTRTVEDVLGKFSYIFERVSDSIVEICDSYSGSI
jgi:hypothetical protein